MPASTRSTPSTVPIAFASTFAVVTASEPASASSERCTALSAPIDSALRIASVARSGPMVSTVTSEPSLRLLELQRLLDRPLVDLVEHRVGGVAVQHPVRVAQLAFRIGVGHLLDQHDDVHRTSSTSCRCRGARLARRLCHRRRPRRDRPQLLPVGKHRATRPAGETPHPDRPADARPDRSPSSAPIRNGLRFSSVTTCVARRRAFLGAALAACLSSARPGAVSPRRARKSPRSPRRRPPQGIRRAPSPCRWAPRWASPSRRCRTRSPRTAARSSPPSTTPPTPPPLAPPSPPTPS